MSSLDIQANDTDSDIATKTAARGLAFRIKDTGFIITLISLHKMFSVAGPVTRQLQGIAMDLAIASQLVATCRQKFESMRSGVDNIWLNVLKRAREFITKHKLTWSITERKGAKKMAGETSIDETSSAEERLKVGMFVPVLDALGRQLEDRFSDDQDQLL